MAKQKGWLDKYGEEINANEGSSSAPKEWMGEGYSNVGRDYSPAWGGQFKDGGYIPQAQDGLITPTIGDTIHLNQLTDQYIKLANARDLKNTIPSKPSSALKAMFPDYIKKGGKSYKYKKPIHGSQNSKEAEKLFSKREEIERFAFKKGIKPTSKKRVNQKSTYYDQNNIATEFLETPNEGEYVDIYPTPVQTTPAVQQQNSTPTVIQPVQNVPQGHYRVEYFDPELKQETHKMFMTQAESDAFAKELGQRNLTSGVPAAGNITQRYEQFAMGGSIPGSVGFTYARTKGIPSEGPYAKKTIPSAQSGLTQNQTKEEVTNTDNKPYLPYRVDYTDPKTGKHASRWFEDEEASRYFFDNRASELVGVQGVQGYYEKPPGKKKPPSPTEQQRLKDQAELKDTTKSFYNQWYNSPMHAQMLKESLRKPFGTGLFLNKRVKQKTQDRLNSINNEMDLNLQPLPQDGIFDMSSAGHVNTGNPNLIQISPFSLLENQKGTSIHEGAHVTDLLTGIPRKDTKKMQRYADYNKVFNSGNEYFTEDPNSKEFKQYVGKDTEGRARVMEGKYILSEIGSQFGYDPFKQKLNKDQFYKAEELSPEFKKINNELRSIYSEDEILDLHNTLSKSNNNQPQTMARNGGMTYYQNGLDWKPKSISKNGGWLNKYAEGGQAEKICYDENGYRVPCVDEAVPIEYTFDKNDPNLKKHAEIKKAEKSYIDLINEFKRNGVMSEDEYNSILSKHIPNLMDVSKYKVESPLSVENQPIFGVVNGKDAIEEITDNYDFPVEKEYRFIDPSNMYSVFGPSQSVIGFANSKREFYPVKGTEYATKKEDLEFLKDQKGLYNYLQQKGFNQPTIKQRLGGSVPQAQTGEEVSEEVKCGPNQVYLEGTGCIDIRSRMYKQLYESGKLAMKGPDESVIFPTMEPLVVNSKLTEDQKRALLRKDMLEAFQSNQNQTSIGPATEQSWYERAFDIATHPGTAIRAYNKKGYVPNNLGAVADDMGGSSSIINTLSPFTWAKGAYNAGKQFGSSPFQTTKDVLQGTGNLLAYGSQKLNESTLLPGQTLSKFQSPFGDAGTNARALEFAGNVGEALPLLDIAPIVGGALKNQLALSKESGLLSKAHKLNPRALTEDMLFNKPDVVNRQIFGDEAFNTFLKHGPTVRPNVPVSEQLMEIVRAPKSGVYSASGEPFQVSSTIENKVFKYPYFQKGSLWFKGKQRQALAKELGKERILTAPESVGFVPAGESTIMHGDNLSKQLIDDYSMGRRVLFPGYSTDPSMYSVYEPHWWQGYKKVPTTATVSSSVENPINLQLFGFGRNKPTVSETTPLSQLERQAIVTQEELARANQDAAIFSQSSANRAKLQEFRPGENFSVSNQQARFIDDPEALKLYEAYKLENDPNLSIDDYLEGARGQYGARNYGDLNDIVLVDKNQQFTSNIPSKSAYTDAVHETTHSRSIRLGATDAEKEIASDAWSPMLKKNNFGMPEEEAFAVQNELRLDKLKDVKGDRVYTEKDIPEIEKGLQEMIDEGHDYLRNVNVKDFDMPALIKSLNKIGLGATIIGIGGKEAFQKKKKGGVVKDNRGYWNPDNWGKVVEIDSPDITMRGVNQPLVGISDEGDVQYMEPGKDYKFKGKKVKEYPVGKNGINQQDEKVDEQLDQLTNFTNYNKPTKGGWLDKYN